MLVICDECDESFDSNDVVIDRGEMACTHCASVVDLDDAIRDASRAAQSPVAEPASPPGWMQVEQTDDELTIRWRLRERSARAAWILSILAVGMSAIIAAMGVNAANAPRFDWTVVLALLVVAPIGLLLGALSLAMWLNSTVVSVNAQSVSVRNGPISMYRPYVGVPVAQVAYFWSRADSASDEDTVYPLSCATTDGELVELIQVVRGRESVRFLKERLAQFLSEIRSKPDG